MEAQQAGGCKSGGRVVELRGEGVVAGEGDVRFVDVGRPMGVDF